MHSLADSRRGRQKIGPSTSTPSAARADNVFTRIGNYDYTNIRAKSRYAPNQKALFQPGGHHKEQLQSFGDSRRLVAGFRRGREIARCLLHRSTGLRLPKSHSAPATTTTGLTATPSLTTFSTASGILLGHSLYFMRNNFFFVDTVAQLLPRVTLYAAYRINKDNGQGNRLADPTGTPGTSDLVVSDEFPVAGSPAGDQDQPAAWIGISDISTTTTTKARWSDPGRRTITRICLIRRCAFTLVARNSCEVRVSLAVTAVNRSDLRLRQLNGEAGVCPV